MDVMMGKVPTGIKANEPLEESIRKIDKVVQLYGWEATFERVREFREYPWVGHVRLHECCTCLACQLEKHLFRLMERGFTAQPRVLLAGSETTW